MPHSLTMIAWMETMRMKRLIVLTALTVFLASSSGCSMFNGRRSNELCDVPQAQTRMPRLSFPWRRRSNECRTCGQPVVTNGPVCNACSGPLLGTDPITTAPIVTQPLYESGTLYEGRPIYEGTVLERMPIPTIGPEMNVVPP